jgi:predicted RNA-binding protein (virulence factor B family)
MFPMSFEIGETYCFVYLDHEERPVATTLEPYILLNEFALLRVNMLIKLGVMDWGMEKKIFSTFKKRVNGKRGTLFGFCT